MLSDYIQRHVLEVYKRFPLPKGHFHRAHPAVTALAIEAQLSTREGRQINPENITTALIKKRCSSTGKRYPQWPTILTSAEIGANAERQADELKWWLPLPPPDDDDDESDGDYEQQGDDALQGDEDADMDDGLFLFLVAFLHPTDMLCRAATPLWKNK